MEAYLSAKAQLARVIEAHADSIAQKEPRPYPSIEAAVDARLRTTEQAPNFQSIERSSAEAIVRRGTTYADGAVRFTHDNRISGVNARIMAEEDAFAMIVNMPPTLCLLSEPRRTWPGTIERAERRFEAMTPEQQAKITIERFEGQSHHLHIDSPQLVLPSILRHIRRHGELGAGSKL